MTLQEILGFATMMATVERIRGGLPNPLGGEFLTVTDQVIGNIAQYLKVDGPRQMAQTVHYGTASRQVLPTGVSEQSVALLHAYEHIVHKPQVLQGLMSVDNPVVQQFAVAEIGRQTRGFLSRFQNLRVASVLSAFGLGNVYFDGQGKMLGTSSGAKVTVNYGIPAGNTGKLDVFGTGALFTSWATASNDIPSMLRNLKDAALKKSGYELTTALYGTKAINYLMTNNFTKDIIIQNPRFNEAFMANEIPDGFLGFKWKYAGNAQALAADGVTWLNFWDEDQVVFLPDLSPEWYGFVQGTYPVPTNLGAVSPDAVMAANFIQIVSGMFSYATLTNDPTSVKHYAGDTFLPLIKVPGAVYRADVGA